MGVQRRTGAILVFCLLVFALKAFLLALVSWHFYHDKAAAVETSLKSAETTLALGGRVGLASADVFDLELVPGVGDSLAEAILSWREITATPATLDCRDLDEIRGVGPKTAEHLCRYLDPSR